MKFKTENAQRLQDEWNDPKLASMVKTIVNDSAQYAKTKWNWDFVITSIHRTAAEDAALHASGIHVDWRAVDVRTNDRTQQEIDDAADYINGKYIYDAARPALKVCFKEPHGNGVHAHYQVHPHTRLRPDNAAHSHLDTSAENHIPHADFVPDFRGEALPLDSDGLAEITERLGVRAAELWAVLMVETRGCGFQANRHPFILYERHIFSRLTNHQFDAAHADISRYFSRKLRCGRRSSIPAAAGGNRA